MCDLFNPSLDKIRLVDLHYGGENGLTPLCLVSFVTVNFMS
jgi:hypothetical protein